MSILAEVLESAVSVDIDDINKNVPEIKRVMDSYKNAVINNLENVYVKYKNRSYTNDILLNKALQTQQTLTLLKEKAEFVSSKDLVKTNQELNKNITELQNVEFALQVVLNVLNSLKLLGDFNDSLALRDYIKCVEIVKELSEKIEGVSLDERLEVINELKATAKENCLRLENDLKNIFTDNIQVTENQEEKSATLKIRKPNNNIKNVILALYSHNKEVHTLNCLARDLWNHWFVTLVNSKVELKEKEDKTFVFLHLSITDIEKKSDYQTVFGNLKKVLQFLQTNFNYDLSDTMTTLCYIGDDIRDNLSELIIKNCLRDTIPSTAEGLENYKVVIEHTKELEKVLLDTKIFQPETESILEYASNIDVLFINKKCEEYLKAAIEIMKKDLHDMVEVGVPYNPEYPLGKGLDFPQCYISKNVQELLNFCKGLLEKALQASPENSGRLFTTVSNILLKYRTFVPEYHKNYLINLPQQIALFLNNCRYIGHILVEWNIKYCDPLKTILVACDITVESNQFPIVGLSMFNDYIEGQIKQVNEIMSGAQLDGLSLEKLDPKTEKCVRQCLRQQELLRTVWHKVLPNNLYNQNIGTIVDMLCKNIIIAVIRFEDISAKVAEQLVDVIKLVLTRAPKLFIDPNEVTLYVPSWYKLNELSFILSGSLIDINDRWADGKGPLGMQFEGAQLKSLIKALFQNTDRRAAVLAKISEFNP